MSRLLFAIAALTLAACSSSSTTASAPSDVVPADGSYVDAAAGYALSFSSGTYTLTTFARPGQAVVKSGSIDWSPDGTVTLVPTTSSCAADALGIPESGTYTDDGAGFDLTDESGTFAMVPGAPPGGLVVGCYVGGIFAPTVSR